MGTALRRYWWPAIPSSDLPKPDSAPVRVRLLGEDFVVFRDTEGRVGMLDETCCHRGASLVLGRVEQGGIRCLYHGWKFAVDGTVLETPNCKDPAFKTRFKARSYPAREAGGFVWVYIGPKEEEPPFVAYDYFGVEASHRWIAPAVFDANFVQVLEGFVDSSHLGILHQDAWKPVGFLETDTSKRLLGHLAPDIEAEDTDFGFCYAALRTTPAEDGPPITTARLTAYVAPTTVFFAMGTRPAFGSATFTVPVDDVRTIVHSLFWDKERAINEEPLRSQMQPFFGMDPAILDAFGASREQADRPDKPSRNNHFLQDRDAMARGRSWTGLPTFIPEDVAICGSMGPIYDRSREHLVPSDVGVLRMRRALIESARRVQRGERPIGLDKPFDTSQIRCIESVVTPANPWQRLIPGRKPPEGAA
ncbi:Rieske 2Fe-2S domain-containing protein [Pendulispora albinea]|uniref:Rieske 2Fe-2S domain-containing protein n=1 Tax=Pendulispora albinea TaxID=2741071 RepID=A0ABZ2LMQ1_9BACT